MKFLSLSAFAVILLLNACDKTSSLDPSGTATTSDYEETYSDSTFTTGDWTTASHSKEGEPNFSLIFDDTKVQRLDLVITEDRWQSMINDMTDKYGTFGGSSSGPGGGGPGGGGGGGNLVDTENPIFVPAEVYYEGKQWYKVGVRFKGNSSLQSTWTSGNLKLSFKLDFDEFEDEYPTIDNQRFYGFKKLSLKNNYNDTSFLREKVATDVFRDAGMAASHTAFFTVYVDRGDGPTYFGLYTLTEEVDDTVIKTQYINNDGNLYKPDGDAATFASGSFDEDELEKKTNEDEADFSDVEALFAVLHQANRTTDAESWRNSLDAVFNTDVFLKYLAINTTIQNWDTYGRMTHNYFLYNDPADNKLAWIPWDNNESLQTGNQQGSLPLNFSGLSATSWPIIGYLYADPVYKAKYDAYLQEVIDGPFEPSKLQDIYTKYETLVEPYATSELSGYTFLNNSSSFYSAISTLKSHVSSRTSAVESYLK